MKMINGVEARNTLAELIEPAKTALLVVDMQKVNKAPARC